ncbi:MAG: Ig-like domain-containing protein [Bacteroidetes bacterium]|nr:Ig-like domain-containing protein [Bacteroidota bacterium]
MKRKNLFLSLALVSLALIIGFSACKKKTDTITFAVSSITAGGVNINGATVPNNVPANTTSIVVGFTLAVNPLSATSDKISLVRGYDTTAIPLTITVVGSTITLGIAEGLGNGSLYQLSFKAGISSTDGEVVGAFNRSFTTIGNFIPDGMIAYWTFENNADDQVGSFNPAAGGIIDLSYADSYKASQGKAGSFNGTTTLVEIPNGDQLDNTDSFTLSFWVKSDSSKHGQFVMGLAGWYGFQFEISGDFKSCKLAAQYKFTGPPAGTGSEDLWFPADGNLGWQGWTFCRDLTSAGGLPFVIASKWANIVCRYNAATKVGTMYINGQKEKEQDFNLWPAGDPKTTVTGLECDPTVTNKTFVFGFIQDKVDPKITDSWADYNVTTNNHFKGLLDDVMFFHKALTEQEITLMYNSFKP